MIYSEAVKESLNIVTNWSHSLTVDFDCGFLIHSIVWTLSPLDGRVENKL